MYHRQALCISKHKCCIVFVYLEYNVRKATLFANCLDYLTNAFQSLKWGDNRRTMETCIRIRFINLMTMGASLPIAFFSTIHSTEHPNQSSLKLLNRIETYGNKLEIGNRSISVYKKIRPTSKELYIDLCVCRSRKIRGGEGGRTCISNTFIVQHQSICRFGLRAG